MDTQPLKSHRDLIAWQRAMQLVELTLPLARRLGPRPAGLASQIERAAISIPTNIAEGYGRSSRAEYLHFLAIAASSLRELETHLELTVRCRLANIEIAKGALELADETGRILHGLRKSLAKKNERAQRWPGGAVRD